MGLLDDYRNKLKGLLGDMPLTQMAQGRAEVSPNGLLNALRGMPVGPDAQGAYEAALNVGPMMLGKIVYHGSPHKFDKFDASKIGTGEGAQAYGHGVYLADAEKVAQGYRRAGETAAPIQYRGEGIMNWALGNRDAAKALPKETQKALAYARDFGSVEEARRMAAASDMSDVVSEIDRLAGAGALKNGPEGNLYKSDLPDEWIPKMLDWDKPLSQQSPEVQAALKKAGWWPDGKIDKWRTPENVTGADLVRGSDSALMPDKSSGLAQMGIPGIRYLDGGSRPNSGRISMLEQTIANLKGKGASQSAIANTQRELDAELARASYNYVVFPGLEDKVKILERNGVPLNGLLGGN